MDIVIPSEFEPLWRMSEEQPVVKYPAEVLRAVAAPVARVNKRVRQLIEQMVVVTKKAHGIGLAAPQVGVSERVVVVSIDGRKLTALVNPVILRAEGEQIGEEGCLSLPGLYGEVLRKAAIEVEALDAEGRSINLFLEGLSARVVQHEIDHLDGVLFVDKVDLGTLHWAWPAGAVAS